MRLKRLALISIFCHISNALQIPLNPVTVKSRDHSLRENYVVPQSEELVLQLDVEPSWQSTTCKVGSELQRTQVSLPVENPTKSFWLDTPGANPLAEEGSTGHLIPDADVCIIGSGVTGVSAAWHLSKMLKDPKRHHPTRKTWIAILEARQFCSGATGRNGGHLTRNMFSSFIARQSTYNTSEAIKSYLLEKYTTESVVQFLRERKLEEVVDLFEGGHVTVFRTKDEEEKARGDFEAAEAAGLDLSDVRWIGRGELAQRYGLNPDFNYTGVWYGGHNLWPSKLVTEMYKDAQVTSPDTVDIVLHTMTPVTSITRRKHRHLEKDQGKDENNHRQWSIHTPRGDIACRYIVHATNAYTGHLLPFFAGAADKQSSSKTLEGLRGHELSPSPFQHTKHSHLGGITPTRGQVGAVRASIPITDLHWYHSWDGGGGGWEYWFPRFQGLNLDHGANVDQKVDENDRKTRQEEERRPLIILGGGRQHSGGDLEAGVCDDASLNAGVHTKLREFLPGFFPGQFEERNWEMEWTGIMGFTKTGNPFVGPVIPPHTTIDQGNPYEGQYIAAGYTGHGMPRAFACAEAVAGMIKAKMTGEEWEMPEWLPESYLTSAALQASSNAK